MTPTDDFDLDRTRSIDADDWPDTMGNMSTHIKVHIEDGEYVGQVVRANLAHASIASLFGYPDMTPSLVSRDKCWANIKGAPKKSHPVRLGVISLTSEAFLNSDPDDLSFEIEGNGLLSDYPDPEDEPSVIR